MPVPEGFVEVRGDRALAVVRADLVAVPPSAWWSDGVKLDSARGRGGGVVRAEVGGIDVVLRTYRRGGLLRRLLPDVFPSPARALDEVAALAALLARGVSTVEPIAAVARRRGPWWELRLATAYVPDALPLPAFAAAEPARRREAIRAAGAVVGAAFAAGLLHRDLHPDNLIARRGVADTVEVFLLDLDRARVGVLTPPPARDAMLVRMARYLLRHRDRLPVRPSSTDTLRFLAGLGLDRPGRRAALGRLTPALRRQAARRKLPMPGLPRAGNQTRTRSA